MDFAVLAWTLMSLMVMCHEASAVKPNCERPCPRLQTISQVSKVKDPKCKEAKAICRSCAKNSSQEICKSVEELIKPLELLEDTKDGASIRPPGCTEENAESPECEIPSITGRKKRQVDHGFHPKFIWYQDNIKKKQRGKCCITTKRTIQYVSDCGPNCYPVYCPYAGGHQFIDEVQCDIANDDDRLKYKVFQFSQPNKGPCRRGKGRKCTVAYTLRTYLVSNVPPMGWFGHCLYDWTPSWFKTIEVPTHCYCSAV